MTDPGAERGATDRAPRRLLAPDLARGELRLTGDVAHHAVAVLRLAVGDAVQLFDGRGREADAEILEIQRKPPALVLRVAAPQTQTRPAFELSVALSTPKGARADWAVEKLTELGVVRITWLRCERSVVEPGAGRLQRWARIAAKAAQQCGRADLPVIEAPRDLAELVSRETPGLKLIAQRGGMAPGELDRAAPRAVLLVGPEGGFTRRELESAEEAGYTRLSLGLWTLRSETAAVAGAAALLGARQRGAP